MAKSVRAKNFLKAKDSDYESEALSNKEQRKLKKILERSQIAEEQDDEEDEDDEEVSNTIDLQRLAESGDEDDEDDEDDDEDEEEEDDEEEQDEDEDVPLSEVEIDSDADVVPFTKLTINNTAALKEALSRIAIPWEKYPFDEHQSLTYHTKVEPEIKDIYDDTDRELQFFKQGLDAAIEGRKKLLALKVPFSRPMDYFAEMVKSDEHMDKLKTVLVKEATEKKAREEARRQRQLKKFGKQVQHETLQQRQKEKREGLEKIKSLKKKRQNQEIGDDEFNIAVEEAAAAGAEREGKRGSKRQKTDQRFQKKSGGSAAKSRPGKSRRNNRRN